MNYFDRNGKLITLEEWAELSANEEYKRLRKTEIDDIVISTVWLGINHQFGSGPPLIFETMIFDGESEKQWRYTDEKEALFGHENAVKSVERNT